MRKFILITAMVLVAAAAQAGELRGLTLASNEDPLAASPVPSADSKPADARPVDVKPVEAKPAEAKPVEVLPAETPKYVDRPAAVDVRTKQTSDQCPCAAPAYADGPGSSSRTAKPRRRHYSTEARVIYELHRHGIYW